MFPQEHFLNFLKHFVASLGKVTAAGGSRREEQPGDVEGTGKPHKISFAKYQMHPRVRREPTLTPDNQLLRFGGILHERCLHG